MTITDHLQSAREHAQQADEVPRYRYAEFVGHLLCALENLIEAVDQLHQQQNKDFGRLTRLERDYDNH